MRTKTRHRTTAPQWMFSAEMYVMGGHVGDSGDYANHLAPYTKLRLEVWDRYVQPRCRAPTRLSTRPAPPPLPQ